MPELGNLERIDPREVWRHEARDFTPWLASHIDQLGAALGLELELVQRESNAGDFSVDLLAHDLGRDRAVVIENQLEPTDHSHLGQLLTYAASAEAGVVVWICREFRDEHRLALDWLNRIHGATTEFFGVVIEALRIDSSKPAVNFRLVAAPVNWQVSRRREPRGSKDELSDKRVSYQQFFQRLLDVLREKHRFTNARAGQPQNWYSFATGVPGFRYGFSFAADGRLRAELYVDSGDSDENYNILEKLRSESEAIIREFGASLEWEDLEERRACRVACYSPGSITDAEDRLEEHLNWAVDRLLRFKRVFGPRIAKLRMPRA